MLLAKLPSDQQEQALKACFKEVYASGDKATKILLPVRNLQFWIATNVLLILKEAPFNKAGCSACADRWQLRRLPQVHRSQQAALRG